MKRQLIHKADALLPHLIRAAAVAAIIILLNQPRITSTPARRPIFLGRISSAHAAPRGINLYEPVEFSLPAGSQEGELELDLESDAFVGVAVVGSVVTRNGQETHVGCKFTSVDGSNTSQLRKTAPGMSFDRYKYQGQDRLFLQFSIRAGRHIVTFEGIADRECHSVIYVYAISVPESDSISAISIGNTFDQHLAAGDVNTHRFSVTDAPRTVSIYALPASGSRLQPVLRLYRPGGVLVATALYDSVTQDARMTGMKLPQNGEYVVAVQDWNHLNVGDYRLIIEDTPALVLNVEDARLETLPFLGLHEWILNIEPRDLPRGNVECIAYSLVAGQPKPQIMEAPRSTDLQSRAPISGQPGTFKVVLMNDAKNDLSKRGGAYVFGCADVGEHRTIGIGGTFDFTGDSFTRFIPAIARHAASFSLSTATNRNMQLELWLGSQLIDRDEGSHPSFEVVFPENGVYTLIGKGAPGTAPEIVAQQISIDWISKALPPAPEADSCIYDAAFVSDVTVPDDTPFEPGTEFVKTWRLRNSGTCDWEAGLQLLFVEGSRMAGPASVPVPPTARGATVDISLNLQAPREPGTYRGTWCIHTADGQEIGDRPYVQIVVPAPPEAGPTITKTRTTEPSATETPAVAQTRTVEPPRDGPGPTGLCATPAFVGSVAILLVVSRRRRR